MKGKSLEFQDACIALKQQMGKGRIFKDNKGRQLVILEAPKGLAPIDVEITTISNKPSEKRGKAKLMIHKPNTKKVQQSKQVYILVKNSYLLKR